MSSERHPQPDSPAPAQPSHSPAPWRWSDEYTTGDNRKTWSLVAANGYGILSCDGVANSPQGLGGEGRANASILEAAPSLYAYAKAEALASAYHADNFSSTKRDAFFDYLHSIGWVRGSSHHTFLETYLATALAIAEGK